MKKPIDLSDNNLDNLNDARGNDDTAKVCRVLNGMFFDHFERGWYWENDNGDGSYGGIFDEHGMRVAFWYYRKGALSISVCHHPAFED